MNISRPVISRLRTAILIQMDFLNRVNLFFRQSAKMVNQA